MEPGQDAELTKRQFQYSSAGLICGFLSILTGALLFVLGITGQTTWVVKGGPGYESNLLNAAPGIFLFVIGLALVVVTRLGFRAEGK